MKRVRPQTSAKVPTEDTLRECKAFSLGTDSAQGAAAARAAVFVGEVMARQAELKAAADVIHARWREHASEAVALRPLLAASLDCESTPAERLSPTQRNLMERARAFIVEDACIAEAWRVWGADVATFEGWARSQSSDVDHSCAEAGVALNPGDIVDAIESAPRC